MATSTFPDMISTTARYALQAVVYLASRQNGFVNRAEIAKATSVPHDYLLKVLNALDSAEIVESRRGPGGGYRLIDPAKDISALDVVSAVDVIQRITSCPLGIANHESLCPLHRMLDQAAELIEQAFATTSIEELAKKGKKSTCPFPCHESISSR